MSKVLIFGAGGFVGAYLSREFLSHGYDVVGTDIARGEALPAEVRFIKADLLDAGAVAELVSRESPGMIINLAAVSSVGASWKMPQATMSVNVVGALNILEAARALGESPKVMFIGSSEEYESGDLPMDENTPLNANNPYGISKMAQERFAGIYRERYKMKVYCVRPFNHTGIGQKDSFVLPSFCRQAAEIEKSGKPGVIKVGNLAAKRDFSDVRDIVRAYRMIIEQGECEKIYNVGSGEAKSLRQMLEFITSLCTQKVSIEVDPDRFRPADTPVICCDRSLIKEDLGWEPRFTIFDTLREMYTYYTSGERA